MLKIKNAVLDAMQKKAEELEIHGVAVFHTHVCGSKDSVSYERVVGSMERDPDPARGDGDKGTNYLCVALSKAGEMRSTHVASGHADRPPKKGEFGWPGGVLNEEGAVELYFAFSGGTGQQDVMVAEAGMLVALAALANSGIDGPEDHVTGE